MAPKRAIPQQGISTHSSQLDARPRGNWPDGRIDQLSLCHRTPSGDRTRGGASDFDGFALADLLLLLLAPPREGNRLTKLDIAPVIGDQGLPSGPPGIISVG